MADYTAREIKKLMLKRLNWRAGYSGAITELQLFNNADIIAVKYDGHIVEYEIKTSRADLRNELIALRCAWGLEDVHEYEHQGTWQLHNGLRKYSKHLKYATRNPKDKWWVWIPNYFYLCIPHELCEYAVAQVSSVNIPYGVYCIDCDQVKRRPKKIHREILLQPMAVSIFSRAINEYYKYPKGE